MQAFPKMSQASCMHGYIGNSLLQQVRVIFQLHKEQPHACRAWYMYMYKQTHVHTIHDLESIA